MDVFVALEERVEKLIAAYKELQSRVAALEQENTRLRAGGDAASELTSRVEELEAERNEIRDRLDKLLKSIAALEL
jgi:prefoldin subunit 5